jgi:undecaprenyl diphosphate synthase
VTVNISESSKLLPKHIAIIMDGNGRWARAHGQRRHAGHRAGVEATRNIIEAAAQHGIKTLTLFAFSSENWNRPREEVSGLMSLFVEVLKREVDSLDKNGIRIRFIGAREQLSQRLQKMLLAAEEKTAANDRMDLVLAVAYGGRWDITQAVRKIAVEIESGRMAPADITEEDLASRVSLAGLSAPDLLIRTGGERRVSNFLLWDMAYSELYFTDTLWPQFDGRDLEEALAFYSRRQRRFGRTGDQVASRA